MFRCVTALMAVLFLSYAVPAGALGLEDVRFIAPAELKAMMDGGERLAVLDVRSTGAYEAGDIRIPGDIRIAPEDLEKSTWRIPMGSAIVTYCT